MRPRQASRFGVPTERTAHALEPIRHHGLAVSGTTENDPPFAFPIRDGFGGRADEERIIYRFGGIRPEIMNLVTVFLQKLFNFFFVRKSGVI